VIHKFRVFYPFRDPLIQHGSRCLNFLRSSRGWKAVCQRIAGGPLVSFVGGYYASSPTVVVYVTLLPNCSGTLARKML